MTADTQLQVHESIKDDGRDVADIWYDALKSYKGILGFDLERKFDKVEDMKAFGVKELNAFHKYRHNEKKVDKLRTLFFANIQYIESGTQQLLSAATPAFPPAAAIGTAVTFMLTACRQMSADYDIVTVFFEDMNAFLQRIVILEGRMPRHKAYQNCLMDVFVSFLAMCAFAHKYVELGRFKKWVQNFLAWGQDEGLGTARQDMDTGLNRLQSATGFAILGNTEELQRMNGELRDNQHLHNKLLEDQRAVMGSVLENTEHLREDMTKLMQAFNQQKKGTTKKTMATEHGKPTSARRIRNTLPEVESEIEEYHLLKDTLVADTCTWIFSDNQWSEWLQQKENPVPLVLVGDRGMGKSHLAATIFDKLLEMASEDEEKHTCVVHFYFREQHESLANLLNGIITAINQVAEQSTALCELINAEFLKDEVSIDIWLWEDLIRKLLAPCFRKGKKFRLYLVFDGIDEIENGSDFRTCLGILKELELLIYPVFTTRPGSLHLLSDEAGLIQVEVTKEKLKEDLRALIWARLNSLGNLRKFGRYVTQRIADKAEEASPNMLYAEHMLKRFDELGREGAVIKALDSPFPPDLDSLYEMLLRTCHRRTALSHQNLVLKLLHLVAYAFRPLPLDEVNSLLQYLTNEPKFDIEEIPEVFTYFLRVGDPGADAEARAKIRAKGGWMTTIDGLEKKAAGSSSNTVYSDGRLPVKFRERSMRTFFTNAGANSGSQSEGSLRWSKSEAHREIFRDMETLARPVPGADLTKLGLFVQKYATHYVLKHWQQIEPDQLSEETRGYAILALWRLMSNQCGYAEMIEWNGTKYDTVFPEVAFDKLQQWVALPFAGRTLNEDARQWWESLKENHKIFLMPLAKVHLHRLYVSSGKMEALKSFGPVQQAFQASQLTDELSKLAKLNFADAEETSKSEHQAALALPGLLDVDMDGQAYRIVAEVLLNYQLRAPADEMCQKAISLLGQEISLEKLKTLVLMGQILSKRGQVKKASKQMLEFSEILDSELEVPPAVRRQALNVKARILGKTDKIEAAAQAYTEARAADPSKVTDGDHLELHLELCYGDDYTDYASYINTLKSWTPLERLTWMAWKYEAAGDDRDEILLDITALTGEEDFVISMYKESIKYLDNVNAGAPLRSRLAKLYLEAVGDVESARQTLDEVFDSGSTGWPWAITEEAPDSTLENCLKLQSGILFRMFRESSDPKVKQELLDSAKALITRPLALDVPPESDTWLLEYRITVARMVWKMGTAVEFQTMFQGIIDVCIQGLTDNVGWNDTTNLIVLAQSLRILSQIIPNGNDLEKISLILSSARFCRLSSVPISSEEGGESDDDDDEEDSQSESEQEDEDESDSDQNTIDGERTQEEDGQDDEDASEGKGDSDGKVEDDEEPPSNEGDLGDPDNVVWVCDGSCIPNSSYTWWGSKIAYQCNTCGNFLCDACHEALQEANKLEKPLQGRKYCGKGHDLFKVPIQGWQGVKDGIIRIEGEKDVRFEEFLQHLKDVVLKKAWEDFWTC